MVHCRIFNRNFSSKNSLNSHNSRFHKGRDSPTRDSPTRDSSTRDSPTRDSPTRDSTPRDSPTKKRQHINEDISNESGSENDQNFKRSKPLASNDPNDEKFSKLVRVAARLIKEVKQVPTTFSKVGEDMAKVINRVDKNEKNIHKEMVLKEMKGSGIDMEMKRFYHKMKDQIPNLFNEVKEIKSMVDINERYRIFDEELNRQKTLKKEIKQIEKSFIDVLEIRKLFDENNKEAMMFKIKELKNALKVALIILELSEEQKQLLGNLYNSSRLEAIDLLDVHFNNLKVIFEHFPMDEDLKYFAKIVIERHAADNEDMSEDESGEDADDEDTSDAESGKHDSTDEDSDASLNENDDQDNDESTKENDDQVSEVSTIVNDDQDNEFSMNENDDEDSEESENDV